MPTFRHCISENENWRLRTKFLHGSTGRQQSRLSWQREKTELFRPQNHVVNRKTLGGNDFRVFKPKEQRGGDIHARSHRGGIPHGYELAVQKDGSVTIRLPLRLSKRSSSTEFVCEPLNWLLARRASACRGSGSRRVRLRFTIAMPPRISPPMCRITIIWKRARC